MLFSLFIFIDLYLVALVFSSLIWFAKILSFGIKFLLNHAFFTFLFFF